ncbi:MAG: ABC transporter permease [Candidatus Microthrix sp.]|nr:ABC transporter permease [Candidatus Microthrix sp.]MBK9560314.1 ABC transporter permease [Candidatus Microthrix sp.]
MTFIGLVWHNVSARRMRAALTAGAVAIGVMAVVALGTLTSSLEQSATGFLKAGNADFTIAQKHTDSLLNSLISSDDIASIAKVDGVEDSIGALIELDKYDAGHPTVVQVGLAPDAQKRFGVVVLEGRSYAAQSETEVMLGYTLAESIDKKTGDTLTMDGHQYRVTGLYRTNGVSYGNSTMMFPLAALQGRYQAAGQVTLGFVKLAPGASSAQVRESIDTKFPQLATVNSETDFGRVDNTLVLISAGNTGGSILAAVIAITGVLNTSPPVILRTHQRVRRAPIHRVDPTTDRVARPRRVADRQPRRRHHRRFPWLGGDQPAAKSPGAEGCFPPDLHGFDLHQVAGVRHRRGFPRSDLPCASSCVPLSGGGDAS